MRVWLNNLFKINNKKEISATIEVEEDEINIRPLLNELRLLKAIDQLNHIGMLKIVLNSPTLNRSSNRSMISWDACRRFLEEVDIIDQLEPEQIREFYRLLSVPNLLPVLRQLYKDAGRRTIDVIQARDEKTKDEISEIILRLREYNFSRLIRRANMMQHGIAV